MYVTENVVSDDFYAVVQANQFVRLVSKLTCDEVTLDVVNNCLEVVGNGTYKIPVEVDASTGDIVDYTNPLAKITLGTNSKIGELGIGDISTIVRALKSALSTTVEFPQYMNYYMADKVLASDTNIASCYNKAITSEPVLVSSMVMEMLTVYSSESPLSVYKINNRLVFVGEGLIVIGYAMPGINEFSVNKIDAYLGTAYPSMCKVSKADILQALDRLSLFVSDFDEDIIGVNFTSDGIVLSSKQSDSVETISYIKTDNFADIKCHMYLDMLTSQIKAQTGDTIDLYFGEPNSVKLVDDACNVVSVVCLVNKPV